MLTRGDFTEKRDFIRMGVECPTTYQLEGDPNHYLATTLDLSATGIRLMTDNPLSPGTRLTIHLQPEKMIVPPLKAVVEVIRCDSVAQGYDIGANIIEMLPTP
ncbi:PilZ domain-containing protein [Ectothiorhodospiraceae bacterium BW-2]|nr:PilZ domain-containing protein [Ectothiorhodospiraceae bacterium BW-2]